MRIVLALLQFCLLCVSGSRKTKADWGLRASDAKYDAVSLLLRKGVGDSECIDESVYEYCTDNFKRLRRKCGVVRSTRRLGRSRPENCVRPLTGGGSRGAARRGSLFLLSRDNQIIIKQESKDAIERLVSIADAYEHHLSQGPSLLPRFIGAYRVNDGSTVTHWLLMRNILSDLPKATTTFDLKGSRAGRRARPGASTLKDLDAIDRKTDLSLLPRQKNAFIDVLRRDTRFLQEHGLLDYSLLLGLLAKPNRPWRPLRFFLFWRLRSPGTHLARCRGTIVSPCAHRKSSIVMGLIDILQPWSAIKRFEFCARGSLYGFDQISAVPPSAYRERFLAFLEDLLFVPRHTKTASISSTSISNEIQ